MIPKRQIVEASYLGGGTRNLATELKHLANIAASAGLLEDARALDTLRAQARAVGQELERKAREGARGGG